MALPVIRIPAHPRAPFVQRGSIKPARGHHRAFSAQLALHLPRALCFATIAVRAGRHRWKGCRLATCAQVGATNPVQDRLSASGAPRANSRMPCATTVPSVSQGNSCSTTKSACCAQQEHTHPLLQLTVVRPVQRDFRQEALRLGPQLVAPATRESFLLI